jgi:hypothetical protein
MRRILHTLAISSFLLAAASAAHAQVSFDIRIGPPPPPRVYRVPPQPGPGFEWVEGYWYPQGSHYRWHDGYWTRPPFAGAYWVAPYHVDGRYYAGRWEDGRRNFRHDHRWDRGRQRDEGRDRRRDDRR